MTVYNLIERTTRFSKLVLEFVRKIPQTVITRPMINQLVRAGTSVGANYREADDAESRNDFCHKLAICKKEARETEYWIELLAESVPQCKADSEKIGKEAKELNLIFNAIIRKVKSNLRN